MLYDYNSNAILVQAITNRQAQTIVQAWEKIIERLTKNGHKYNNFILNNEISSDLRTSFQKYKITCECVPPKIHRRNAVERSIQKFKNNFLAGLAKCNKKITIQEWERLLHQAEITLN